MGFFSGIFDAVGDILSTAAPIAAIAAPFLAPELLGADLIGTAGAEGVALTGADLSAIGAGEFATQAVAEGAAGLEGFGGAGASGAVLGGAAGAFDTTQFFSPGLLSSLSQVPGVTSSFLDVLKKPGVLSSIFDLGSGVLGLNQAGKVGDAANRAAASQDPFGPQRPQYQAMLQRLMADPSSVTNLPGYQFGIGQGEQALMRTSAARGMTGSGGEAIALQQYGQNFANQFFQDQFNRLSSLSGANIGPSGGGLMLQGAESATQLQGQAASRLGAGALNLLGAFGIGGPSNLNWNSAAGVATA